MRRKEDQLLTIKPVRRRRSETNHASRLI